MKQEAIKAPAESGRAKTYVGAAIVAGCAAILGWVYWPSGGGEAEAGAEVEARAERIAEELRKKEPKGAEAEPVREPVRSGGPLDVRSKARGQ
ncbi:MAG: hypothetical protein AB7K52_02675 [Phycisphaerales bacterium]